MSTLEITLTWLGYLLLLLSCAVGLFLNLLGLPGIWLIPLCLTLFAWATGFDVYVGIEPILITIGVGIFGELAEFFAGAAGSRKAGGSRRGMIGALAGGVAGGILGTPVFPIVGTIVGSILGSFAGAVGVELLIGKNRSDSTRVGVGAAIGRAVGIVVKTACGAAMAIVALVAAFPLGANRPPTDSPEVPPVETPATIEGAPENRPADDSPSESPAPPGSKSLTNE